MAFSVIILSKTASNLAPCVSTIFDQGERPRIIVVDDGIDWDETPNLDLVTVVQGIKPFIYARNVNLGIKAAGTDDVILLNDDALLTTRRGFSALGLAAQGYGIVSPAMNNCGNPNQWPAARNGPLVRREDRTLCFVCVYIPRATIDKVGLLDERFVHYGMEDDDYCLRVRNAGFNLGIFDDCFIDHSKLKSSFRGGPEAGGDFRPNLKLFIEKWGVDNWGHTKEQSDWSDLF